MRVCVCLCFTFIAFCGVCVPSSSKCIPHLPLSVGEFGRLHAKTVPINQQFNWLKIPLFSDRNTNSTTNRGYNGRFCRKSAHFVPRICRIYQNVSREFLDFDQFTCGNVRRPSPFSSTSSSSCTESPYTALTELNIQSRIVDNTYVICAPYSDLFGRWEKHSG